MMGTRMMNNLGFNETAITHSWVSVVAGLILSALPHPD
jgi:hypothetical protein